MANDSSGPNQDTQQPQEDQANRNSSAMPNYGGNYEYDDEEDSVM